MCFPPFAYGKALRAGALDAIDFVAIAIPSLCSLRHAHIRDIPLIMSLATWVENRIPKWLAYFHLVLGTRHEGVWRRDYKSLFRRTLLTRSVCE